jgi:hypothetical protein
MLGSSSTIVEVNCEFERSFKNNAATNLKLIKGVNILRQSASRRNRIRFLIRRLGQGRTPTRIFDYLAFLLSPFLTPASGKIHMATTMKTAVTMM